MTPNLHKPFLGLFLLLFSHFSFSQTTITLTTTGAGTWTVPADVYAVDAECWGGGGGGCGSAFLSSGGGGGGGGYAEKVVCVTPGQVVSYNVGVGGAQGRGGTTGGDTWFSSNTTVKAAGGGGGVDPVGTTTSSGGTANVGTVTHSGGGGGGSTSLVVGGGGGGGVAGISGNGANGTQATSSGGIGGAAGAGYPFTGGNTGIGGNGGSSSSNTGNPAINYGGGGGGAASSTGGNPGGTGGQGILRLTYTPLSAPVSASVTYSASSYCTTDAVQTATLTGSGAYTGGTFTATPTGLTLNTSTGDITPAGSTAATYTVTYSITISGCPVNLATATVTINAGPTVNITASPNTAICEGNTIALTAAGTATSYNWSGGITNGTAFTPVAGTTTYTVTGTGVGCNATATYTVTVNPVTATASNTGPYCTDGQIALSATGSPTATFSWSGPNGFISAAQNPTLAASGNGGVYSVTITDGGCPAVTTTNVVVNGSSAPTNVTASTTPASVCPGGTVTLNGTANGASSWSWTGVGGFTSAVQNPSLSPVTAAQSGTYTLVATNACGSAAPVNTTVSITSLSASISGNLTYCTGTTGTTLTASGGTTYQWNDIANSTTASVTVPAGTYTVTATTNSCTATSSATVTSATSPTVSIVASPNTAVCAGTTVSLTASGASTYAWSSGQGVASINVAPTVSTTYTVTGTALGCSATASYAVTVNPAPTVTITASPNTQVCAGTQVTLSGVGATTYSWSGGITDATAFTPATGTTTYTVTGTSAGCSATASYTTTVNPNPTASNSFQNITCNNANDGRIAVQTTGGTAGYTYVWMPNVSTSASAQNLASGSYSVTVTDSKSCTASTSATITNPSVLSVTFNNDSAKCNGQASGVIRATATGGVSPYHFSVANSVNNSDGIFSGVVAGNYTVSVVDNGNCVMTFPTNVYEPGVMRISVDPTDTIILNLGETIEVTASSNVSGATFSWSDANAVSCANCSTTTLLTSSDATYTAQASVANGACTVSIKVPVVVKPNYDVFVPTAFSPNDDGNNDEYAIFTNKKALKYLQLRVFDRWGEMVYQTYDIDFKWNGQYHNAKLDPDVYTYYLQLLFINNHSENSMGSITIIK